ncbi:hypothetical protein ACP70R_039397 [Stipagrostis hirtigluma subsp. patula]
MPNCVDGSGGKTEMKVEVKETKLGMVHGKDDNFEEWYTEIVVKSEMMEYYDISGCYILRPWAMDIWELLKEYFDSEIKRLKVKPYYFPLFLSENVLKKEKDHFEGVAHEVFRKENVERREQVDLTVAAKWYNDEVAWVTKSGKSYLEAPIAIRPTRAVNFFGKKDIQLLPPKKRQTKSVLQILELYRKIYEEFLAVPVFKGRKSEMEKFAGGIYTTTVEAFIPNTGCGIQGATSHFLGQNFAKIFDITFENEKGSREMVWQNSWAYTTRSIGVMIMTHGDDKGLVLPPRVASVQLDNHLVNKQVCIVRRDNGTKVDVPVTNLVEEVRVLIEKIQENMFKTAKEKIDACTEVIKTWNEFIAALNDKKLILAPWCDEQEVEKDVKARTKGELGAAKTLCTPFEQPELPEGTLCFASGKPAKKWSFWGRSY